LQGLVGEPVAERYMIINMPMGILVLNRIGQVLDGYEHKLWLCWFWRSYGRAKCSYGREAIGYGRISYDYGRVE
jgi:hypothetical protein